MPAILNQPAPELDVAQWVQGEPVSLKDLNGSVVLVEVFQVNCPGCFLYALPEVIRLHEQFHEKGLVVLGLATAFEDYDKNNLKNLQGLINSGSVVGETEKALAKTGELVDDHLRWRLPFPVAMDSVKPNETPLTEDTVAGYVERLHPDIKQRRLEERDYILKMAEQYLKQKTMVAATFENYELMGTPSSILIDREGILRDVSFGQVDILEPMIIKYLRSYA
jgi:thiol-disulfide isomerase/thioredoxin